jgi:sugar O-acyltransferase (sialic acid O-acetyltransferase NeuD family)
MEEKAIYGIYGASGFGREILPLVREKVRKLEGSASSLFFVDDNDEFEILNIQNVLNLESFLNIKSDKYYMVIAIAESEIREKLTHKCLERNINLMNVKADNVVELDDVDIKAGFILCPFVTLTSNIMIGKSFHANIYSYVAHDCVIGDYVTFAPGVKCNGNVVIGDHAYIGTGAIIKQGKPGKPLTIGKNAIIGAGAVVTKDIPEGMTVFGNPAIELTKENLNRRR